MSPFCLVVNGCEKICVFAPVLLSANGIIIIQAYMFSGERTKIKGILRRSIVNRFHLVYNKAKPVYESVLGTKSI
ncbi:hypothetical protein EP10_002611 [Geobacillus icigianus]|uniref:Uncharacterized protein n=1 Tax=Geobacillus icigianus TaxID=1430331 RepID=A0ABU6BIC3_9BACL|nr:hypothetical protein [Geobacillus icigianus]